MKKNNIKRFLVILFPILLMASAFALNDQGNTAPATNATVTYSQPIVEEVKSPVAPEVKTINTAPATVTSPQPIIEEIKTANIVSEIKTVNAVPEVKAVNTVPEVKTVDTASEVKITTPADSVPLSNNNSYTNTDGEKVHSPAYAPSVPSGASAICQDGTYSFSHSRRGTCSHHGGVAEWL